MRGHKITLDEHKKIGAFLKILDKKLEEDFKLSGYDAREERYKSHEWKSLKFLFKFRREMEEIMTKDYPGYLPAGTYFGELAS